HLPQKFFETIPNQNFAINVPVEILSLFHPTYTTLGDVVKIGTGISTGNDRYFLRAASEVADKDEWIPFYKNGGVKDAWYYPPKYYIHEDWPLQKEKHSTFTTRNPSYFYREGITCSSMGVEFSAAYLPRGSLFGVNANLFPDKQEDLYYFLGLLNSQLVKYVLRKLLNRTNMITAGYIKKLPYIDPSPENKKVVIEYSRQFVKEKMSNSCFYSLEEKHELDRIIYDIYGISHKTRMHVEDFCNDLFEKL
ncbi:TaqI-like C-terminal specificity domain-containing protein, partial [Halobacillus sp. BBL2006]|uniref:TaqI-like C-terminal specificity domain-containing protein n=1 Tax=Halobacillus sp. BBL2006 TaxID=1543706 RepID=UPI000541FECB